MLKSLILFIALLIGVIGTVNVFSAEKPELQIFEGKLKKMGGEWFLISEGDFFQLALAPEKFLLENDIVLNPKEPLKAEGIIIDEVINVYRILTTDNIIELRDASGNPFWQEEKQVGHYKINSKKCIACQLCVSICPTDAISMIHGKAVINADKCIDCAICEIGNCDYKGCPTDAIKKHD
jgi:ferredoxin